MAAIALKRERNVLLAALLTLAAGAWAVLLWQSYSGPSPPPGAGSASMLTMGMGITLFIAIWIAMMAAMMFPTAAPMILIFARMQSVRRDSGRAYVPTSLFVASYVLLWSAAGALAFFGALAAGSLADRTEWLGGNGPRVAGVMIALAGLYQLTPLKAVCLRQCRSPFTFVLTHWRDGRRGAVRMGLEHGMYCLGCCWLLFVLLFPLGIMNIAAMGAITAVIFIEKSTAWGMRVARGLGFALLGYGIAVVAVPWLLPGSGSMSSPLMM